MCCLVESGRLRGHDVGAMPNSQQSPLWDWGPSASVQRVPRRTAASSSTPPEGTPQAPDLLLR